MTKNKQKAAVVLNRQEAIKVANELCTLRKLVETDSIAISYADDLIREYRNSLDACEKRSGMLKQINANQKIIFFSELKDIKKKQKGKTFWSVIGGVVVGFFTGLSLN